MTAEERLAKRLGLKVTVNPRFEGGMVVERDEDIFYASDEEVAMYEELLRLEREREWIKVTPETMPERGKDVLVCVNGDVEIDQLHKDSGTWLIFMDDAVTHWRPLPEPPTVERED